MLGCRKHRQHRRTNRCRTHPNPPQTDIPETENTRVVSNPDRSSHTITTRKTPNATGQYHTCWHFGANDPFGDYRLQVHIGDITFPPYPFRWQP
uniref:Uncharacterized protein n=1 Tax=Conchiformibius kuhniae TaxID=211502 RepID=A0A8T9MUV1_9NEIS|nr:hypothetical protein LVJ77_10505 [Conchiformibius kuhniae]